MNRVTAAQRFPWIPLRETLGDDIDWQAHEPFNADASFVDSVSSPVAQHYLGLTTDANVAKVMEQLHRRGFDEREIEILYRLAALIPRDWQTEENEPWALAQKRRASMQRHARALASLIAQDPEWSGCVFQVSCIAFGRAPETELDVADVPEVNATPMRLADALSFLGHSLAADAAEEAVTVERPTRRVSLQSFVLREIYALLEPYFPGCAPNWQTAAIASVLLNRRIDPASVTKLRKDVRRPHFRDKE